VKKVQKEGKSHWSIGNWKRNA